MSTALKTFGLFAALPAELRLEIWKESCTPRVVELRYSEEDDRCITTTKPPSILHASRESRHEGLRLYAKIFGTKTHPANIYFSTFLDVLYMPRCGSLGYGDSARDFAQYVMDSIDGVHSLAIDHVPPEIMRPWETYNKFCLMKNFPDLKETFLIFSSASEEKDAGGRNGQIEFVDPRADKEHIMKLMEDVTECFNYEVGYDIRPMDPGMKESEECNECPELRLALIPKTKAVWHHRPAAVACI